MPSARRMVAVINSNEDVVNLIREALEDDGYSVCTGHIAHYKHGQESLLEFLEAHDPRVIVYDIGPPYGENWTFLQLLRAIPQFAERHLVLTTVNRTAFREEVGTEAEPHELRGRRDDLGPLLASIGKAFRPR